MDVQDLSYLQHHLDQDPRSMKYRLLYFINVRKPDSCCLNL